jgi:hypothetical protein
LSIGFAVARGGSWSDEPRTKIRKTVEPDGLRTDVPKEIQLEACNLFMELFGDNEKVMNQMRDAGAICTVECTFNPDGSITIDDESEMERFLDLVITNTYRSGRNDA